MTFAKRKELLLGQEKSLWKSTFLYALIVATLFFLPHIIAGRGYFLFYGDFNVQQIPFYQMCHQMLRSGNFEWNIYTDLGVNFVGSYSFYLLGSPFFWITLLFPNSMVPYLMGPLLILKFACAALTAYFYLRRFTRTAQAARLGGLLYAFSGFSVYNIFFNHFHEAIIFFPLLLLSVELFMTEKRRGLFALCVFACAISNYFFFFGMVVFVIIYWFVRMMSKNWKIKITDFLLFVFEAVLGVLCAAAILYPTVLALINNTRLSEIEIGWNAWFYGKNQIFLNVLQTFFFPPDLPARPVFFPDAEVRWSSLGGWLPLFSMVGFVAFWQHKKGHWLRRVSGICILMALVPFLNSTFYMFNSAYYARWFYMPILMFALMTVIAAESPQIKWNSALGWVLGITVAVTVVIGLFPAEITDGKITKWGLFTDGLKGDFAGRYWLTCAIAIACLTMLWLFVKFMRERTKEFIKYSTVAVCIISVIYATIFIGLGKTHSYTNSIMIDGLIEGKVTLPGNTDNYRIDVYDGVDNTGMYLGLPCINSFHSIVPPSVTEFYEYIGEERGVASRPTESSYAIRPLLSVKYLLNNTESKSFVDAEGKTLMAGFKYLETQNGFYVYENENYIPYGFTYEHYMNDKQCDVYGQELRANMMLKAILLTKKQIEKYGKYMTDIGDTYSIYVDDSNSSGTQTLLFDDAALALDSKKLAQTSAVEFSFNKNGFYAKTNLLSPNLVFFSVPYDEGWSATVNGKRVEVEKVNVGFMAVEAPAGQSEIVFTYTTPGLRVGIVITGSSLLILVIYVMIFVQYRKKHPVTMLYPEGEHLLGEWQNDAIIEAANEAQDDSQQETCQDEKNNIDKPTRKIEQEQEDELILPIAPKNKIEGAFEISDAFLDDLPPDENN